MMSLALRQLDRSKNMRRVLDYNLGMSKTLYIIDGHAQIFRAYFAIRGGMNSPTTGEPTHAVFGMAGMMLKLLGQVKPDLVAPKGDGAKPSERVALVVAAPLTAEVMGRDPRRTVELRHVALRSWVIGHWRVTVDRLSVAC